MKLRSLFDNSPGLNGEVNVIQTMFGHIKTLMSLINFKSMIIENYFITVSFFQTKTNLKNGLKLLMVYYYGAFLFNTFFLKGDLFCVISFLLVLSTLLVFYLSTLFITTKRNVTTITWFVMLIVIMFSIINFNFLLGLVEIHFTPIIQFTVLMFSNLPINVNNSVVLSFLSIFLLISTGKSKLNYKYLEEIKNIANLTYNDRIELLPIFDKNFNIKRYSSTVVILVLAVIIISLYLHFINNVRRRSAFIKFGKNIQRNKKLKDVLKTQIKWIEAIMPRIVKEEYLTHTEDIKRDKWVYIKTFDNVSILFADIINFTKLSFDKTATEVVSLLNDLFNEFDDLCALTNCEKTGTLGDCYYCTAGCPIPRYDHALCCIEMGLAMCRILEKFNINHNEDISIRVGVHTGRVNAAILGKERFRFDVYSNDVNIANLLESTGEPNRVHISQTTYDAASSVYDVENGKDLKIKREETHGIAGTLLKTAFIKTYYVCTHSAKLIFDKNISQPKLDSFYKMITSTSTIQYSEPSDDIDGKHPLTISHKSLDCTITRDLQFIEGIKQNYEKKRNPFVNLPINTLTTIFDDREIQWHYTHNPIINHNDISWETIKLSPFLDSLFCSLYSSFIYLSIVILFSDISMLYILILFLNIVLSVILVFIIYWSCVVIESEIQRKYVKLILKIFTSSICKYFHCTFFMCSPLVTILCLLYDCRRINAEYIYTIHYFMVTFFSTLVIPLYVSGPFYFKITLCLLNFSVSIITVTNSPCITQKITHTYSYSSCLGQFNITDITFYNIIRYQSGFQLIIMFFLAILIMRELEKNIKLWFFVSRETEIQHGEIMWVIHNSEKLLYNIIPKYVFIYLKIHISNRIEMKNFNYALTIPKAGVIFVCISNFFSKYYREDYKGGENALRLLHKIFCDFDNLLKKEKYNEIEKIKSTNDCYMVASGLNKIDGYDNRSDMNHLKQLMDFCLELLKFINVFNERYIIGFDKFELKIGYNFGPITAGIIGAAKPMYDIWGDTVNIASRMYYTCTVGHIQVPIYVKDELKKYYLFRFNDTILVKGKCEMDSYFCLRPLEKVKNNSPEVIYHTPIKSAINQSLSQKKLKVDNAISKIRQRNWSWSVNEIVVSVKGSTNESEEIDKYMNRRNMTFAFGRHVKNQNKFLNSSQELTNKDMISRRRTLTILHG